MDCSMRMGNIRERRNLADSGSKESAQRVLNARISTTSAVDLSLESSMLFEPHPLSYSKQRHSILLARSNRPLSVFHVALFKEYTSFLAWKTFLKKFPYFFPTASKYFLSCTLRMKHTMTWHGCANGFSFSSRCIPKLHLILTSRQIRASVT